MWAGASALERRDDARAAGLDVDLGTLAVGVDLERVAGARGVLLLGRREVDDGTEVVVGAAAGSQQEERGDGGGHEKSTQEHGASQTSGRESADEGGQAVRASTSVSWR